MSKIDPEINRKRGEHVKELLKQNNRTQVWLAEQLYVQPEHLNMMLNGKRNLGEDRIQAIARLFPDVKLDWLLGLTDYKTTGEFLASELSQCQHEGELLMIGLRAFAQLSGYEITFSAPASSDDQRTAPVETWLKMFREGYTVSGKEGSVTISLEDMNRLQNEICDFVEFKLNRLCERGVKNG